MFSLYGQSAASSQLPTLTHVAEVRQLTREKARLGYPVHMRVVVTYFDPSPSEMASADLFVQDSTGGQWVQWTPELPKAVPGQIIDLQGVTTQVDFAPDIAHPRWTILAEGRMPEPKRVTFEQMASTGVDSQRVEVEGLVRSAERLDKSAHLRLVVQTPGGRVIARVISGDNLGAGLVDSRVRIRGSCGALFNKKNQIIGVMLYVPSVKDIQILEAGPADPFALPAHPLGQLQAFSFTGLSSHRVKVSGVVTAHLEGNTVYVADQTGSVYVESSQSTPLTVGDQVEVVGFPSIGDYRPVLRDAICRRTGFGPLPAPVAIQADQVLPNDQHDSALVTLQGRLTTLMTLPNEQVLTLNDAKTTFSAIGNDGRSDIWSRWRAGSLVRVTGICVIERDAVGNPQSFKVRLRSSRDIALVQSASWWTLDNVMSLLGFAALMVVLISAWVAVLRRRVQSQTAELHKKNEVLAAQAAELARSNSELEQFAYVASHDLQEPLRMVSSYTQLLAKRYQGKLGQDADEFIAFAVDGARRMQNLINDLLAYSRVGTRGGELRPVDAEAALSNALMNLQGAIEESGATIAREPMPGVYADPVQLGQIFQNLIGNAIKFRNSLPPHVHVASAESEKEWRFSIKDNGIGIDPAFSDRIFQVFQRLHNKKDYPGTGIGLAICKKIAERHGGRIWVESEPGQGATFHFTIRKKKAGL